jgi:hypothetical protein
MMEKKLEIDALTLIKIEPKNNENNMKHSFEIIA